MQPPGGGYWVLSNPWHSLTQSANTNDYSLPKPRCKLKIWHSRVKSAKGPARRFNCARMRPPSSPPSRNARWWTPRRRAGASAGQAYSPGGRVGWAEISTAGRYAVTWVVARPNRVFQPALLLLHRRGQHWHTIADLPHSDCPGVPTPVLLDLQHFFTTKKPGFITP